MFEVIRLMSLFEGQQLQGQCSRTLEKVLDYLAEEVELQGQCSMIEVMLLKDLFVERPLQGLGYRTLERGLLGELERKELYSMSIKKIQNLMDQAVELELMGLCSMKVEVDY